MGLLYVEMKRFLIELKYKCNGKCFKFCYKNIIVYCHLICINI